MFACAQVCQSIHRCGKSREDPAESAAEEPTHYAGVLVHFLGKKNRSARHQLVFVLVGTWFLDMYCAFLRFLEKQRDK